MAPAMVKPGTQVDRRWAEPFFRPRLSNAKRKSSPRYCASMDESIQLICDTDQSMDEMLRGGDTSLLEALQSEKLSSYE